MVGDSLGQDVSGAQAWGMPAVHVQLAEDRSFAGPAWPPPESAANSSPDALLTELRGLIPMLEAWQSDDG